MESTVVKKWNAWLNKFSAVNKDIYFREEYVKLYEKQNEDAVCFVYEENDMVFLFPFLRRRFEYQNQFYYDFETAYGYGGPISNVDNYVFYNNAMDSFKNYCVENNYIAGFVRFHPLLNNYKNFSKINDVIFDRRTIAVDLSLTEVDIWMNEIHTKNRNVIKKSIRSGLEFIVDRDFKNLNDFMRLYTETMDKVDADAFYYFDENYYQLFRTGIKDNFLGLVSFGGKIIAGAVFFYSKDYGHYHLSGSDSNYLKENPNNFMLYEAALELKASGVKKFHLGGGYNSEESNSLYQFKRKFSNKTYEFYIGKMIFNHILYEELCEEWQNNYPDKQSAYKNILLKYKY